MSQEARNKLRAVIHRLRGHTRICPTCKGDGEGYDPAPGFEGPIGLCTTCNGEGKVPSRFLQEIAAEIEEVVQEMQMEATRLDAEMDEEFDDDLPF